MKTKDKKLYFPASMYNTPWGSLLICALILSDKTEEEKERLKEHVKNEWALEEYLISTKSGKAKIQELVIQDPDFIDKTLKAFGLERPAYFPIAIVNSDLNTLFAPFIDGQILPLREDGVLSRTLRKGKIHPIDFSKEVKK